MSTHGNLLFGLLALQNGAVDPDQLAETCASWAEDTQASQSLGDRLVDAGCMTVEQKTQIEDLVTLSIEAHGGNEQATLAADVDGRFLDILREVKAAGSQKLAELADTLAPAGDYVLEGSLQPPDDPEHDTNDRYTRTHLHAKGGMGQVWVARDASLGRKIALKELRPDQSDNSIVCSRFLYEARVTAQLEHPGIIPVYEMGGGRVPFYTMRFVKGRTLCEAIRSYHRERKEGKTSGSVGMVKLLGAFVGVCHAVAYAHSRGFIHRDLKGQNVMLGDFGEVIVLDWGIAKQVGPDATVAAGSRAASTAQGEEAWALAVTNPGVSSAAAVETLAPGSIPEAAPTVSPDGVGADSGAGPEGTMVGQLLGTPSYMAPEQAEGRVDLVDLRTDVYGLGAILYELLAGQPPFSGKRTLDILQKVRSEPPRPVRELNPDAPLPLQAVCLKALAKKQGDRYPSATELAQEVERYLADEPVLACSEPWTQRALRWARRHRTIVATAAGLLVTSTIALGVGTALVTRERNEAKEQGQQARQAVGDMYTKVAENWLEDRLDPLQKEFLEKTLSYYETFTRQAAGEPAVRLEHGRAYQRMGDILRKIGRLDEAEKAFRNSLTILEPLNAARPNDPEISRALGLARTRLGDLLLRRGKNDQAEALFQQAIELEKALADAPAATADDQWLMARTRKGQADLLRRKGAFIAARPVYQQAIAALEKAVAASPDQSDFQIDLALTHDALGLLQLELGQTRPAEEDFRQAVKLLEPLVKAFPTVPRFREALAKAGNSLGMIEQADGRWTDSEAHYRRELVESERLAQDFPDRPEFRRELARACTNLGGLMAEQGRLSEAEPILRRGVALNSELTAREPADVQFRLDLARCDHNLGYVLLGRGQTDQAIAATEKARNLSRDLAKAFPDAPRYGLQLAQALLNLGRAFQAAGRPEAEAAFREALDIDEKLTARFPANVEYQIELGRCLNSLGALMASLNHGNEAVAFCTRASTVLDFKDKSRRTVESLREQAAVLSNLGEFRRTAGAAGAEDSLRRSIAISEELVARKPVAFADRQNLAIAQNNLAEVLVAGGRTEDANQLFTGSVAGLDALAAEMPKAADTQNYLGYVCEQQGKLLVKTAHLDKARTVFEKAVAHQRQAVALTEGRIRDYRTALGGHLAELAELCLALHDYDATIAAVIEMHKAVPGGGNTCYGAAKILARCMSQAAGDAKLDTGHRDALSRNCLGRIVVLLREAVDINPKLAGKIASEPSFSAILSRPEFKSLLGTLVELAPPRRG